MKITQKRKFAVLKTLMLSIEKCLKILNKKEKKYTKIQAEKIRQYLNVLADIVVLSKDNKYYE